MSNDENEREPAKPLVEVAKCFSRRAACYRNRPDRATQLVAEGVKRSNPPNELWRTTSLESVVGLLE
jgi:hypothetical protein